MPFRSTGLLISKWVLSPVLLRQGKTVWRTIPRLPEPPGAREGHGGEGVPLRLLIAGDSAAAGVGASSQREALSGQLLQCLSPHTSVQWQLLAKTGLTTAGIANNLSRCRDSFDVAVLSAGVNDVTGQCSLREWERRVQNLLQVLRHQLKVRHIVFAPLPPLHHFPVLPQPLRWFLGEQAQLFNERLHALLADQADCHVLALEFAADPHLIASDGFHPGPPAYALWANAVTQHLLEQGVIDALAQAETG